MSNEAVMRDESIYIGETAEYKDQDPKPKTKTQRRDLKIPPGRIRIVKLTSTPLPLHS
jgi:hypothetical protein